MQKILTIVLVALALAFAAGVSFMAFSLFTPTAFGFVMTAGIVGAAAAFAGLIIASVREA